MSHLLASVGNIDEDTKAKLEKKYVDSQHAMSNLKRAQRKVGKIRLEGDKRGGSVQDLCYRDLDFIGLPKDSKNLETPYWDEFFAQKLKAETRNVNNIPTTEDINAILC